MCKNIDNKLKKVSEICNKFDKSKNIKRMMF